jgi:hypothetical protein
MLEVPPTYDRQASMMDVEEVCSVTQSSLSGLTQEEVSSESAFEYMLKSLDCTFFVLSILAY